MPNSLAAMTATPVVLCSTSGPAQWGGHNSSDLVDGGSLEPTPLDPAILERLLVAYDDGR